MQKKRGSNSKSKKQQPSKAGRQPEAARFHVSLSSAALIIFALSFILYGYSITFGYVLDDEMVITKNAYVQKGLAGAKDIFRHDSFMGYFQSKEQLYLLEGGRYRPLSLFTFAAEVSAFGKDKPHISHFINILLYAFTGLLLFSLSKQLIIRLQLQHTSVFALVTAVAWIIHPVHTECVSNIKGRDEILSLLGALSALWCALRYAESKKTGMIWLASLFFFAGLLAKENALTFIAVIPLSLFFFRDKSIKSAVTMSVPLFTAALLFILIRYQALGYMMDHGRAIKNLLNDPFMDMTASGKYATIVFTLGWYVRLLFLPHPLTHDYYPYHFSQMKWSDAGVILSLLIYAALIAVALFRLREKNFYSYCIFFFLLTISIISNIVVSVGTFLNERFLYTPSIAFSMAVAWFLTYSLKRIAKREHAYQVSFALIAVVAGGLFSYKTMARVPDWKDAFSLDAAAIRVSPNSARANCFYGVALYNIYMKEKDTALKSLLVDSMEKYFDKSISIYPSYESAWQMKTGVLGIRYQQDKDVDKLLSGFHDAMKHVARHSITRSFVKQYLNYLYPSYPRQAISFCYDTGYALLYRQLKDTANAQEFIQLGLEREPGNELLLKARKEMNR